MAKGPRTLAEQIADLDDPAPRDLDPENDHAFGHDDDDDEDQSDGENQIGARAHYEAVGKSKFRKAEELSLGEQYESLSVSRDALDAGDSEGDPFGRSASERENSDEKDFDDPDNMDLVGQDEAEDEDIDSDEAFGKSDDELQKRFKFLGSGEKSVMNGNGRPIEGFQDTSIDGVREGHQNDRDDESGSSLEEGEDNVDELPDGVDPDMDDNSLSKAGQDGKDNSSDSEYSTEESEPSFPHVSPLDGHTTLRKLMASDQKAITATISQAAKADAAKGRAVKRQRSTFDALLNARIKLQKSLVATNSLPTQLGDAEGGRQAMEAAENAALALWSTIEDLRQDLAHGLASRGAMVGQKRKRPVLSASSDDLWIHIESVESDFIPHRRSVLDKWSAKTRAATAPETRGRLLPQAQQLQGVSAVLDAQLTTEAEKLVKRTRIPRAGAPMQAQLHDKTQLGAVEDDTIFDDTDFYQLLLRELIEQRMDSASSQVPLLPISTSLRATRVKSVVDTKASKGRKMRYTVHEKLQDFMAPEDRGTWTDKARDEFFGSLLGGRADKALAEEDEESEGEVEALRLFRT